MQRSQAMRTMKSAFLVAMLIVLGAVDARADQTAQVKMTLMPSGAMPKLGGYRPQQVQLSTDKPEALKKTPQMAAPLYGQIRFGGTSYLIALDEPEGKD